jgi:hypothetical protein
VQLKAILIEAVVIGAGIVELELLEWYSGAVRRDLIVEARPLDQGKRTNRRIVHALDRFRNVARRLLDEVGPKSVLLIGRDRFADKVRVRHVRRTEKSVGLISGREAIADADDPAENRVGRRSNGARGEQR